MADASPFEYDPEILARTSTLKIHAINLVEGILSGQHRSPHKGSSVEFAEYKDYSPGDDIRHIDWKVVGRTDKYHIKQFEQSTNLKCTLLLDCSGSMGYQSPLKHPEGLSKMDYARTLAAALAYLLLKQFDAVGLTTFSASVVQHIPPRSKPSHFQHIVHGLGATRFEGVTRLKNTVSELIERLPRRGLLILISDMLCRDEDALKTLKLLASKGLEVVLLHVMHPDEVSFPFDGDVVFESLEDDPAVGLDPVEVREPYQRLVRGMIENYQTNCPSLGIDYLFLETSLPLDQALRYFLLRRRSFTKV